jgi:hypothetical protein
MQRDQHEVDRLRTNAIDQFENADVPPEPGVGTRAERLARELRAAGAPSYMIWNARRGVYDRFRSTQVNPHGQNLISDATKLGLWDIAVRAQAGEFDAPLD